MIVSVIITTKNEEKNIRRNLESINRQSFENIETILVDNNSTDKTVEIAKTFTNKVYIKGPERSVQRNFGVDKSMGDYLLILDADMELGRDVVKSCVENIDGHAALIIPEKTLGSSFMARLRNFEREMYVGDATIEVARFFKREVFEEFEGYDEGLTGAEDYDLPARISKKYSIGWSKGNIYHHEAELTLIQLLKKKFYYASRSVSYADKHPDLIFKQGTIIFRNAYLKHAKNFFKQPVLGLSFLFVRFLVMIAAVLGFIKTAGIKKFIATLLKMLRYM